LLHATETGISSGCLGLFGSCATLPTFPFIVVSVVAAVVIVFRDVFLGGHYRCSCLMPLLQFIDPLKFYALSFAYFTVSGGKAFAPTRIKKFPQAKAIARIKCHTDNWIDR